MTRHAYDLMRADFEEMPGLCLTLPQMQRLWRLDRITCDEVVRQLVAEGFLRRTAEDEYRHAPRVSA